MRDTDFCCSGGRCTHKTVAVISPTADETGTVSTIIGVILFLNDVMKWGRRSVSALNVLNGKYGIETCRVPSLTSRRCGLRGKRELNTYLLKDVVKGVSIETGQRELDASCHLARSVTPESGNHSLT